MSQYNEGKKAFTAMGTVARYSTVKLNTSKGDEVVACGSNEANIGFAAEAVVSGEPVTVFLKNSGGTFKAIAHEAITVGAALYNHASGRVGSTSGGTQRYVALEAATAQGDIIEVLPVETY